MRLGVILLMLVSVLACKKQNDVDIDNGVTGNNDVYLPDCPDHNPPGQHGPPMVHVGKLGGGCFWIDQTEVTRAQYQEFLASNPQASGICTGKNDSFSPVGGLDTSSPELPIGGVDWCDASAYCAWAGKRLCGTYAGPRGSVSEMASACTNGDNDSFRYGDQFSLASGHCQGDATTASAVGTHPDCKTPTDAFDLVGNVWEWTAECSGAEFPDPCKVRGGSYTSKLASNWGCNQSVNTARTSAASDIGFRCCADDPL